VGGSDEREKRKKGRPVKFVKNRRHQFSGRNKWPDGRRKDPLQWGERGCRTPGGEKERQVFIWDEDAVVPSDIAVPNEKWVLLQLPHKPERTGLKGRRWEKGRGATPEQVSGQGRQRGRGGRRSDLLRVACLFTIFKFWTLILERKRK